MRKPNINHTGKIMAITLLTMITTISPLKAKTPRQMLESLPVELHVNNVVAVDSVSPTTMSWKAAEGTTIEIAALPSSSANKADSLFCVLTTCNTPEPETTCAIYDTNWQKVKSLPLDIYSDALIAKPDSISEKDFRQIKRRVEMPLVEAHFSRTQPSTIVLRLHVPLLDKEDKKRVESILTTKEAIVNNTRISIVD